MEFHYRTNEHRLLAEDCFESGNVKRHDNYVTKNTSIWIDFTRAHEMAQAIGGVIDTNCCTR